MGAALNEETTYALSPGSRPCACIFSGRVFLKGFPGLVPLLLLYGNKFVSHIVFVDVRDVVYGFRPIRAAAITSTLLIHTFGSSPFFAASVRNCFTRFGPQLYDAKVNRILFRSSIGSSP